MTTAQLYENVRLSMTVPKGSIYKRPEFGHRFDELSNEEVADESTRRRAETYAREALQWMLDVERGDTVEATAMYDEQDRLFVNVELTGSAGQSVSFSRFVGVSDVQQ